MTASSDMLSAAQTVIAEPSSQSSAIAPTEPASRAISAGTPKMPLPMMAPTRIAPALQTPSRRLSSTRSAGVSGLDPSVTPRPAPA